MSFPGSDHPDKIYNELAAKWLDGSISPEEEKQFLDWYNESQNDTVLIPHDFAGNKQILRNRILKNIQDQVKAERKGKKIHFKFARLAAAVMILALGTGAYLYIRPVNDKQPYARTIPVSAPLSPAPDTMAVLTLSDGSSILLDHLTDGSITRQGNAQVIKSGKGVVQYRAATRAATEGAISYNTISTPKGGRYQVVLPDHSIVWLNASSSLRFPTAFTGKERNVELTGEGYFEVAKNKSAPFKITVNNIEVAVLGTHFNIMAYNEEAEVNTTLLEGAVKVVRGNAEAVLKPGQQAQWKKGIKELDIQNDVNIEQVIAWKNGEFRFENTGIKAIMRQIARWYDVRVEYRDGFHEVALTGSIARYNTIPQLLEILEATHRIHFTQQGNLIEVEMGDAK